MTSKIVDRHIQCPSCPSSDAYCTYEDGHGYCFSCQTYFPPPHKETLLTDEAFTYEYLPWRGVSKETMAFFDCKTKIDSSGRPVEIGYKYPNGSYKIRTLAEKNFRTINNGSGETVVGLFGQDKFEAGTYKYLTITEGELDALSLYQVLKAPVVSVRSSSSAARDVSLVRSWANAFERVYLCFDNDTPGREATQQVAKLFDFNKVYEVKLQRRKDANEYLQAGEAEELRNIWWTSKRYLPANIISSFEEFKRILTETPKEGVTYPFPTLSKMTYGLRTSESVLITAQEGVGKTELMHTLEHHLLEKTNDNVGAIFMEEPNRRHLQSLAGIQLHSPVHLPDSGRSDAELLSALQKVIGKDERLFIYSHFGSDDPDVLLDTIRFLVSACGCKYILLDHITMAVTGLAGERDERRALDYISTRLEMMVVELDFCLIVVSHVNDDGLTRGSRNIAKVANTRIDLKRNLMSNDPVEQNTTDLFLTKNRFGMKTGHAGRIYFDQDLSHYRELGNDNVAA